MVEFLGLLKVRIVRGITLAVRDLLSSDPYVVVTLGSQVHRHWKFSTPGFVLAYFTFGPDYVCNSCVEAQNTQSSNQEARHARMTLFHCFSLTTSEMRVIGSNTTSTMFC